MAGEQPIAWSFVPPLLTGSGPRPLHGNRAPADHTRATFGQHVPWPVSPRTVKGHLVNSSHGDWPGLFQGRCRGRLVSAAAPQVSDSFSPFCIRSRVNTVADGGPGPGEAGARGPFAGCKEAQRPNVLSLVGSTFPDFPLRVTRSTRHRHSSCFIFSGVT